MGNQWKAAFTQTAVGLFARAGVFSADSGGQLPEGVGAIILFSLLGAFLGLLAGLMISHIIRYISYVLGRNLGGFSWAVLGAIAGAVVFAWLAAVGEDR